MKESVDSPEGQKEYKIRGSTFKAPSGILKVFYDYNKKRQLCQYSYLKK